MARYGSKSPSSRPDSKKKKLSEGSGARFKSISSPSEKKSQMNSKKPGAGENRYGADKFNSR